jgi:hypothetical protein
VTEGHPHSPALPDGPVRPSVARPEAVPEGASLTFAEVKAAIEADFAGAGPIAVRDLLLLRVAAERALRAGDFREVARVHRQIARAEARLRDGLKIKARTRDEDEGRNRLDAFLAALAPPP